MTPEQFDKATPQERNEAIARALGWTMNRKVWTPVGQNPLGMGLQYFGWNLPDWQGDDGLAFKEIYIPFFGNLAQYVLGTMGARKAVWTIDDDARFIKCVSSDTWAHAIAKAFLQLKASKEGK